MESETGSQKQGYFSIASYLSEAKNQIEANKEENVVEGENSNGFNKSSSSIENRSSKFVHNLSQIKGPTGSVRGYKDVVRRNMENFNSPARRNFNSSHLPTFKMELRNFEGKISPRTKGLETNFNLTSVDEENTCIAYTTSLGIVRRTFEDSKLMRKILTLNLIRFEERDIYLNEEYKNELRHRLGSIQVPALFVDGQYLGGIKEFEAMNEDGNLNVLLGKFKMPRASSALCQCCGNARFIACQTCHGSRKSAVRHFKFNSIALRCIKCDKNDGIIQCPSCS